MPIFLNIRLGKQKKLLGSRVPDSASEEEKNKALAKCRNITYHQISILLVLNA
jgi:hypothetical protein